MQLCVGKMYKPVKEHVQSVVDRKWDKGEHPLRSYENGEQSWWFMEFGYRCDCWKRFYGAIYTEPEREGKQYYLEFARPANLIITNIGVNETVLKHCLGYT
ncbi:MAG: hypothetical protein A2161_03825 [Candidatus Schekmanbacteria bacterium RBG_13_48_7]|uniref:Uncharacterized protein n=1 Tax=Candidatus Schekmanbacteria bacterium RBG_13_48_7 TaxID=1817878 RepID=A0A1F7S8V1_9BACT|nr:MAG: hypothetical protein A2161_03825 [Candidatus Schekmanbacteria bacterium RBG_13_48_7]